MQSIDIKNFQDTVSSAQGISILLPQNPDLDSVGAALSLYLAFKEWGKETSVVCPTPMLVEFNRLVGVDKVAETVGDRNLVISFENYNAAEIEKVSYDVQDGKFMLVVSPKPGAQAPTDEQVKFQHRGVVSDVVIIVGAQDRGALGKFAHDELILKEGVKVALVGKVPAAGFGQVLEMINPQASSVSEVVFQIIESIGLAINKDIAGNLFAGLREGTNNFTGSNVSVETFTTAARLMKAGAHNENVYQPEIHKKGVQPKVPADWIEPKIYKGSTLP